ncbi:MAG: hypothetical protein WCT14_16025 [Treponemataceae bacterium]
MKGKKIFRAFLLRVMYSHVVAYFLAGIFAVSFMNYKEHYASASLSLLMRPVSDPIVALGPMLQVVRGFIIGAALLPFRKLILEEKFGFLKLGLLVLGISSISTIGPTPGSFEGIIYTILPLRYHLLGIPETIIYIALFVSILGASFRYEKKWITVLLAVSVLVICLFSTLGFLSARGIF